MNNNALIIGVIAVIIVVGALVWAANRSNAPATTMATDTPPATDQNTYGDPDLNGDMGTGTDMATPDTSPMVSPDVSGSPSPMTSPSMTPSVKGATTTTTGAVKDFTVTGSNYEFDPATITVKQGDTVRVTFKNTIGTHDWNLDEFNAHTKVIQAGQQETVQFVADKAGQFEYYCSVGNHRQMGMKGTLIVQ